MPPSKKSQGKKNAPAPAAETKESKVALPDDQAISEAKLSASELRAQLWDQGLIGAELPNGEAADGDTPWTSCGRWRCLCEEQPKGGGLSCAEAGKVYENKNWKRDCEVGLSLAVVGRQHLLEFRLQLRVHQPGPQRHTELPCGAVKQSRMATRQPRRACGTHQAGPSRS